MVADWLGCKCSLNPRDRNICFCFSPFHGSCALATGRKETGILGASGPEHRNTAWRVALSGRARHYPNLGSERQWSEGSHGFVQVAQRIKSLFTLMCSPELAVIFVGAFPLHPITTALITLIKILHRTFSMFIFTANNWMLVLLLHSKLLHLFHMSHLLIAYYWVCIREWTQKISLPITVKVRTKILLTGTFAPPDHHFVCCFNGHLIVLCIYN